MEPPHESDTGNMQVSVVGDGPALRARVRWFRLCVRILSIVNLFSAGVVFLSIYIPSLSYWLKSLPNEGPTVTQIWWFLSTVIIFVLLRRVSRASPRPLRMATRVDMGLGVAWCVIFIGTCLYAFGRGAAG